jgi:hypothetical protein
MRQSSYGPSHERADHLLEQRHCPYKNRISQKGFEGMLAATEPEPKKNPALGRVRVYLRQS